MTPPPPFYKLYKKTRKMVRDGFPNSNNYNGKTMLARRAMEESGIWEVLRIIGLQCPRIGAMECYRSVRCPTPFSTQSHYS